ncbi:MAG TPA: hypothetical protein VKE27_07165 [Candidatus Dormibacteraeota bacterium]|nr:hypothetical protein [Candidatus Dormibacteraeota bacterium]
MAVAVRVAVSPGSTEALLALGAAGGVVLIAGSVVVGHPGLVHWGVGVVAGCYVAAVVVGGGTPDAWSPAVAVALLLSSELAGWSIDCRRRGRDDLAVHAIRLRTIVLIAGAASVLAFLAHGAWMVGAGGDVVPALAAGALLATVAGFCALVLRFGTRP